MKTLINISRFFPVTAAFVYLVISETFGPIKSTATVILAVGWLICLTHCLHEWIEVKGGVMNFSLNGVRRFSFQCCEHCGKTRITEAKYPIEYGDDDDWDDWDDWDDDDDSDDDDDVPTDLPLPKDFIRNQA
jgi:hypothetical protein